MMANFNLSFLTRIFLSFILSFIFIHNSKAQCPTIDIVDLRGVPGYAQFDEMSVCGEADTLALIIYTGDPGTILGFEFELTLPEGLLYSGWEYTEFNGTSISAIDPDPENPTFIVDGFDGDSLVVINIGIESNCEVNLNELLMLEYEYAYNFLATDNTMSKCSAMGMLDTELNSAVQIPVLNVLAGLSPAEVTMTAIGSEFCQDISISQDGISSYLDSFIFEIAGLPFDGNLMLNSITANSTVNVPFTYDAGSMITSATIEGDMFLGNTLANPADQQFNTNEILAITVCYELSSCPAGADLPFNYNAYYGCDGEQCQISGQSSYLRVRPTGALDPTASVNLVTNPSVCGADGEIEIVVNNPNAITDQNKYTSLSLGFETCESVNLGISKVEINGIELPSDTYGWLGDDLNVDFTMLPPGFNPDGAGGLDDIDGDGVYDDLPGGGTVAVSVFIEVLCGVSDVAPNSDICPDNNCGFGQFYVSGQTNCGNVFDKYPPPITGFDIIYGPTMVSNDNERGIPDSFDPNFVTNGYDFGLFGDLGSSAAPNPTAATQEVIFCYDFQSTNFNSCANNEVLLQINFTGDEGYIYDIDMLSAELSIDGGTTYSSAANMATDTTWNDIDEGSRILTVNLGSTATNVCYRYVLEMDSIWCPPPAYFFGAQQVIDRCSDAACGPEGCDLLRACKTATFYGDAEHWDCPCKIEGDVREIYRKNYGYSDATMTTQLTKDDVDFADRTRFLPCDTMVVDYYIIVTDDMVVNHSSLSRLGIYFYYRGSALTFGTILETTLHPNHETGEFLELAVQKVGQNYDDRQIVDLAAIAECNERGYYNTMYKDPYDLPGRVYACPDSGNDYYDGSYSLVLLTNYSRISDVCGLDPDLYSGNCLDAFFEETNYAAGDTIRFKYQIEMMKNPHRAAYEAAGTPLPPASNNSTLLIQAFIDMVDSGTGDCYSRIANDCAVNPPYFTTCPGTVSAVSNVNLDNCGGSIEHTFYMNPELPVGWFEDEFRPILAVKDIEDPFFAPMAYCGNAKLTNFANGVATESTMSPTGTDNLFCVPVTGYTDDLCAIETGTQGSLMWNPTDAGSRPLGIGNVDSDSLKISYDFCLICPEELNATSYQMEYDYGYLCETLPQECVYRCDAGVSNDFCNDNGFPVDFAYLNELVGDSLFTYYDNPGPNVLINDTRTPISNVDVDFGVGASSLLSSSNPGVSEEIQCIDFSNINAGDDITGVGATIRVPTTVNFVNAYADAGGTVILPSTLISDDGVFKTYSITLNNMTMAPGTTQNVYFGTTLLFCPEVGEVPPNICVGGISGCSPVEVAAALSAASGCGENEICYAYVFGEVGLQTEWFDMPVNPNLCDEMTFNVRVKNVKELTLLDLITSFELPTGLTVDMTSWEVAFPGGPTTTGGWVSVPAPDLVVGNTYTYSDDDIWSVPAGTPVHTTGIEGVSLANATEDENKVAFRFRARTNCDEFLSGSKFRTETLANDPCAEGNLSSGMVESPGLVLGGADPADNAQLLLIADPLELNCMATVNTFGITAINTSAYPTADSVITCITIPDGLTYTPGSISVDQPVGYTITNLTEVPVGNTMEVCFISPKIGVSQSMKLSFDAAVDEDMPCGDVRIDADIKSVVTGLVCSTGPPCDVFVQNSINPSVGVKIRPPFMAEDWNVYSECAAGEDVSLYYEFTINHNGPDAVNQAYTVNVFQDVDGDNLINANVDNLITTTSSTFSVNDGRTVDVSGNINIAQSDACPIMMELVYSTSCACDREEKLIENIILESLSEYTEPLSMCPGDCLEIEVCDFVSVNADSICGATGAVYMPDLDYAWAYTYSIPHDSTQTPIKKGPPIEFLNYDDLTNNLSAEPITKKGALLFPEQSPSADPSGEAYLIAKYPKPVFVQRIYLAAGQVSGWTFAQGLQVYRGTRFILEYSNDGGSTWTDSGLVGTFADDNVVVEENVLPVGIAASMWRISSVGVANWGVSEFRLEGDPVPFEGPAPVTRSGNMVTICVPEDVGVERPFLVDFDAGLGSCSNIQTLEIWNIGHVDITLGPEIVACGTDCVDLEVEIVGEGTLENTTVSWSPQIGLSDPTSLETEACVTADQTYIATVTFPGGCVKSTSINIDHQLNPPLEVDGADVECFNTKDYPILIAPAGFDMYMWFQVINGVEIPLGSTVLNTYAITEAGGEYFVKGIATGVDCPGRSPSYQITDRMLPQVCLPVNVNR